MMFENKVPIITLDGPSGTGKGTLCHRLAKQLHWHLLDSGSLYRVLAYAAHQCHIPFDAVEALVALAQSLNLQFVLDADDSNRVQLDGVDISQSIRSEACGQQASIIAAVPEIRAALLERQRAFAKLPGLVTDGRDMGTVVFPEASLKIYLYASPEERANRRYLQLKAQGNHVRLAQVIDELVKRDARDTARSCAPLKPAVDAIQIDTTKLTIDDVLEQVMQLVKHRALV